MRRLILDHLDRLDHLPAPGTERGEKARGDWVIRSIELLLRAELQRQPAEPPRDRQHGHKPAQSR